MIIGASNIVDIYYFHTILLTPTSEIASYLVKTLYIVYDKYCYPRVLLIYI